MWPNPQFPADLVTSTEEILNGKPHFFVQCLYFKKPIYFFEEISATSLQLFSSCSVLIYSPCICFAAIFKLCLLINYEDNSLTRYHNVQFNFFWFYVLMILAINLICQKVLEDLEKSLRGGSFSATIEGFIKVRY